MTPADRAQALLGWYRTAARDLPWRRDPTPYHVLLSELMLQQTRVDTALPYFARFLARWPTLQALAEADEDEVLREWAGLGYYARARNLLRCARAAIDRGGLPEDLEGLRALPGIGPYTAGAIASIAFGVRTPLVDGNVERVISRLDALTADPRRAGRQDLWDRVAAMHEGLAGAPGDLNQALMELGATVCTPKAPRCDRCPLGAGCLGRAAPAAYPVLTPKPKPRPVCAVAGLLRCDAGVLLGRRRKGGLLGGLWEPVRADLGAEDEPEEALLAALRATGVRARVLRSLGEVVHVFTHRRLVCSVYALQGEGTPAPGGPYDEVRYVAEPDALGLSALARRILALEAAPPLPLAATVESTPPGGLRPSSNSPPPGGLRPSSIRASTMPSAAIVVIGDEILTGKFADENGPFLIGRLRALGCDVRRLAVVSDRPEDIADEVRRCSAAADHVLTTGGVGPTHDDRTLEGVARAFGLPLVVREELARLLDRHGLERSPTNLRMVTLPEGAELVWSPGASFPVVRVRNAWIFPGVPPLMRSKFEQVASAFAGERVRTARLYTGAPETDIAALLFRVQDAWPTVAIGSYPRLDDGEHVIVTLESRDDAALAGAAAELRANMPVLKADS